MSDNISVGNLTFVVRRSRRRRTATVAIERSGEVVLLAPDTLSEEDLTAIAASKAHWVYRKLAERTGRAGVPPAKEFVAGEGFTYLGRQYRLALEDAPNGAPLKLTAGYFHLERGRRDEAEHLFRHWYIGHGRDWLERRLLRWAPALGVEARAVRVSDLGYRWASCSPNGTLNFHWQAMALSPVCLDYLIVHELAHLREPHHGPAFWSLVERVLPSAFSIRDRLAREGQTW